MLPAGLVAQPLTPAAERPFRRLHPRVTTVVRLLVGACSCDLVRPRQAERQEDERDHRERARRERGSAAERPREALIARLERHRLGAAVPVPPGGWPRALAAFVVEHARNAGPTLYSLRFAWSDDPAALPDAPVRRLRAAEVLAHPSTWLDERAPVLVEP
jgi:hypothetical protein